MSTPILATKLYIPTPRPNTIARARLIKQLNQSLYHKLTLISAPAGFGKSTLVSEWVADCERPVAWLTLDQADKDPIRFLTYLVVALRTLSANIGESVLNLLQSPQPVPIESILTTLLNEISKTPDNLILVIDDYHIINSNSVDSALRFLIEHLPPQLHLVITTREDPQLPLARLRAQDQLTELRVKDLRFTCPEAADFLEKMTGQRLAKEDIAALDTRTEGWIAGLQLAAISMQGHKDTARFITSFTGSHRFILDYLVEEVMQQLPDDMQSFLLRTSILERLCGPLCDAVLNDSTMHGQQMLEHLEYRNLFVNPLDDKRQWYRYHHLFAEMLQARLAEQQPNEIATLHLRASIWYEQNELISDAVRHALAAKNFNRAADLIELICSEIRRVRFQNPTFLEWLKAMPDEIIRVRPVLCLSYARELLSFGELDAAEARLQDAEHWLQATTDKTEMVVVNKAEFLSLAASIANARAFHAQTLGDRPNAIKYAQHALDLLPASNYVTRGTTTTLLGLAYWSSGDLALAYQTISSSKSLLANDNIATTISIAFVLADICIAQGRLFDAVRIYQQSLQLVMEHGDPKPQGTAHLYLGLSNVYCEWGNLKEAGQYLLWAEETSEQVTLPDWQFRLCLAKARIKRAEGKLDAVLDLLNDAERLFYRSPLPDVRPVAALKAQVWISQGRLNECMTWVRDQNLSVNDELSYMHEFEHITLAKLLIAYYKNDATTVLIEQTIRLIDRLLKAADETGRTGSTIEILILRSLAQQAQGDTSAALISLQQALKLAEPENYVRCFVDEGAAMERLLSEAAGHGILPDYVDKLLTAFNSDKSEEQNKAPVTKLGNFTETLIEPLSQRELEVLQLIAQGFSNDEISKRLYIALSTVKGHNRIIFSKLQVQRRTEAVARARQLGFL